MKFLSNSKLDQDQFKAVSLAESVMNSNDFMGWFLKSNFTDLGRFEGSTQQQLYQKFFLNKEHRFSWEVVERPLLKRLGSAVGITDIDNKILVTYKHRYDKMSTPEKASYFASEMMKMMGFPCEQKAKSLPTKVGKYVKLAGELFCL
jgi:hypothetical protein